MSVLFLLTVVVFCEASSGVVRKYFVHSNNWSNSKNWDVSPDPCDAVILPDLGYDYSVLVASRVQLSSLKFPSTGEVVFGEKSSISLSGLGSGQCLSNTYRARQFSWGDPNNWYSPNTQGSIFKTADSDRIPCVTDEVVFNKSSVFNVLLDKSVEVGALRIGDIDLDTQDVVDFTRGAGRSQLQFINLAQLVVTGRTVCTNHQGCLCGNKLDCSQVQCPRQDCVKPIKSEGVCCHYCGAEVRFRPPAGFYLEKFKKSLGGFLEDTQQLKEKIEISVSLQMYDGLNVQITISDSIADGTYEGAGYESSVIASKIYSYIVEYDIVRESDLILQQSHKPFTEEATEYQGSTGTVTGGIQSWVLYIVLGVSLVLLIIIVVLLFKCSRRYRDSANQRDPHIRLDHGTLPRTLDRRFKPCVPAIDQDIPTYEEVLMEDMLSRGIQPDQPRSHDSIHRASGPRRPGYTEIPTADIPDRQRV